MGLNYEWWDWYNQTVKYCVALANEGGGHFILGVTDKRPRKIIGELIQSPQIDSKVLFQGLDVNSNKIISAVSRAIWWGGNQG